MSERKIVASVNVRSVARVALALALALWGIAFVGLVALFVLGLVSGGLGGVEGFIASLGFTGFRLSVLPFLAVFLAVAVLTAALTGVVAGLLAVLYNAVAPLVGGIEMISDRRTSPAAAPVQEVPTQWSRPAVSAPLPSVPPAPDDAAPGSFPSGG